MRLEVELEVLVTEKITIEVSDSELEEWARGSRLLDVADLTNGDLKQFLECGDPDDEVYQHSSHYRPTSEFTITSATFAKRPDPKP